MIRFRETRSDGTNLVFAYNGTDAFAEEQGQVVMFESALFKPALEDLAKHDFDQKRAARILQRRWKAKKGGLKRAASEWDTQV